ncbi:fatty acid desaturase [[Leptolyngbya] sp. PCC 7376]|uniref:fatty acid desaturase n=1 Tax=[Leptolyngbya] sp. PCC 7376 TaxID=111781 RepID=UPI00029EFE2E|nr:fatty acid desaturase [[Leptolyngbya] sp. PCC 7376]AFY37182.1 fatty acid desaturase [[Leptolyngbya] sp. PCC 7376]
MDNTIKKSDFILQPYMRSHNLKATYQVLNTLVPYIFLWFLAFQLSKISILFLPPIILLLVLLSLRGFSLMHDCGHNSLFTSKRANRIVGFVLGVLNAMPQYWWSRDHAYHHKTNGDWEQYRGIGDFLSTDEYKALSSFGQKVYRRTRHPWMVLPGGFFYLAFKPKIILVAGSYDFIRHWLACIQANSSATFSSVVDSHQPKQWGSAAEFWDVLLNNICVVSSWIILCHFLGTSFFLSVYSMVLMFSAAALICIFFIQHNFEDTYAHNTEGWDYLCGAVEGSSYLKMPVILNWFTADIGYHSIHHLSERIPNYNLKACHQKNAHLLGNMKTVQIKDILHCAKFILWDSDSEQLVSIDEYC